MVFIFAGEIAKIFAQKIPTLADLCARESYLRVVEEIAGVCPKIKEPDFYAEAEA